LPKRGTPNSSPFEKGVRGILSQVEFPKKGDRSIIHFLGVGSGDATPIKMKKFFC